MWQPGFELKKPLTQSTIYITFSFQHALQLSPRFTIIIPQSKFSRIEAVANQKLVRLSWLARVNGVDRIWTFQFAINLLISGRLSVRQRR